MSEVSTNAYEGLFLFPHSISSNLQSAVDHVKDLLGRIDAELISIQKWDERRMAYEIKGNKRGVYILTYFRAETDKLTVLDRACSLSEQLLRSLVLRADHVTPEQIETADRRQELDDEIKLRATAEETKPTAAVVASAPSAAPAAEGEPG
jgi:small subunit ribosomal protein S6